MENQKTFYHGSRIKGLKVLEPRLDARLGLVGLFVADEPYGPMMFSLLPNRAHSIVKYETKDGKFIKGRVVAPLPLNEEGWLYKVEPDPKWIRERKTGRYYLIKKTPVAECISVAREEVMKLGWVVEINKDLLKKELGIKVVYETEDFFIINKPAGVLVHGYGPSLIDWLLEHYPEVENVGDDPQNRPGIVHRLDRDTSGVLLVCRNQKTFNYFKKLFQEHQIKKTYLALVYGVPHPPAGGKSGLIEKPIGLKSGSIKRTTHLQSAKMIKEAATEYKVKKTFNSNYSLLEVEPLTGRTHQIRVHLASIGHPVVGDNIYGKRKNDLGLSRQFLHAESLEFNPPTGGRLKVAADMPDDLMAILNKLAKIKS